MEFVQDQINEKKNMLNKILEGSKLEEYLED